VVEEDWVAASDWYLPLSTPMEWQRLLATALGLTGLKLQAFHRNWYDFASIGGNLYRDSALLSILALLNRFALPPGRGHV
jgi:hypothetical protein